MSKRPRPFILIILDGWGYRQETTANAIAAANKPIWDQLYKVYPHTLISGSGRCVGLPNGQMGNSEVGHLTIGAGRIVNQDLTQIDLDIKTGDFFKNPILNETLLKAKDSGKAVHIFGLLSPGGVHSHEKHIQAVIQLAARLGLPQVYFNAFLDGRDTPPRSAMSSLQELSKQYAELQCGRIVSLVGRFYAMDRDKRWERVQKAYELIVDAKAPYRAATAESGLEMAYARDETDEFVSPTLIGDPQPIQDGDAIIFMNFRADRAREITTAITDPNFKAFQRHRIPAISDFVTLTLYDKRFPVKVAYPQRKLQNILGEYLSQLGLKQLRIAETEKYAHVTFFFNAGVEKAFPNEDRLLVPSPKVSTYDLKPEMSAEELTNEIVKAIRSEQYDLIVCNYANPDMVGHTGNFEATVKAIEVIDSALGKIILALKQVGGEAIVTADHGNAERMYDPMTNQPHTAHTNEPVPLIYVGRPAKITKNSGNLSDISPTILYILGIPKPPEMTGEPLLQLV